jgi:hypothetical protein
MLVEPGIGCLPQRRIVEGVHFGTSAPMRLDQPSPLQHVEVLRDRLSRQASAILCKRRSADLKQGLPLTLRQAIKDAAADRIAERLEDIVELVVVHANKNAVILLHVKPRPGARSLSLRMQFYSPWEGNWSSPS